MAQINRELLAGSDTDGVLQLIAHWARRIAAADVAVIGFADKYGTLVVEVADGQAGPILLVHRCRCRNRHFRSRLVGTRRPLHCVWQMPNRALGSDRKSLPHFRASQGKRCWRWSSQRRGVTRSGSWSLRIATESLETCTIR